MNQLEKICPVPEMPWADISPPKRMVRVTIEVPIEDICWDSCTCERDSIAHDRGNTECHSVDIGLASYEGHFVEFDDPDSAEDYYIEEVWS